MTAPGARNTQGVPPASPAAQPSADDRRPTVPQSPRLRHSIAWSLAGNIAYVVSQWGVLATASRLGSPQMVGQLALALAITAPVFMLTNMQMRTAQAADVAGCHAFCEYLGVRLISTASALVAILLIVAVWPQGRTATAVVVFVAASKATESISDIVHGFLQKHERMDLIAGSLLAKALGSILAFAAALALTSSIVSATAASALGWFLVLATYDLWALKRVARTAATPGDTPFRIVPRWSTRKSVALVRTTLPLGLASMLNSLKENFPRYVIKQMLGERSLGLFAATAYVPMAGVFLVSALDQAALPRLAQHYERRSATAFRALFFRLSAIAIAVGLTGVALSILAGKEVLSMLYGVEYGQHSALLTLLMCAAAILYEAAILNCAMNATRGFRAQLPLFAVVAGVSGITSYLLIPRHALFGASFALMAAYVVHLLGSAGIVARVMLSQRGKSVLA